MTLPATQKDTFAGVEIKFIYKELEEFTARLNQEPDPKWLQKTPDNKAEYIPVGIIEMNLRKDFMGLVGFTVLTERRELNEYIVTARISVFHPVIMQWIHYDGIGAKVITQKKDTELNDFAQYKQKNALEMNAPNAYAEAIKNAAKKIGKKYGADINRKHEDVYEDVYTQEAEFQEVSAEVLEHMKKCDTLPELLVLWDSYPEYHNNKIFKKQFGLRRTELQLKGVKKA